MDGRQPAVHDRIDYPDGGGRRIPGQEGRNQHVGVYYGPDAHPASGGVRMPALRMRRSLRASAIIASISSIVGSGLSMYRSRISALAPATAMRAASADARSPNGGTDSPKSRISNGILRSLKAVFANMTNAVDIVMPTFSQNRLKSRLRPSSILMLNAVCAILVLSCQSKRTHCTTSAIASQRRGASKVSQRTEAVDARGLTVAATPWPSLLGEALFMNRRSSRQRSRPAWAAPLRKTAASHRATVLHSGCLNHTRRRSASPARPTSNSRPEVGSGTAVYQPAPLNVLTSEPNTVPA